MEREADLDGYRKEVVGFSMLWGNLYAIVALLVFGAAFGVPFYLIWGETVSVFQELDPYQHRRLPIPLWNMMVLITPLIVGIVLHELIHGAFYALFAKGGFKSVKFGFKLKYLAAYCICTEPVKIKRAIVALIMPAIILGFAPSIAALFLGSWYLLYIGVIFTVSSMGDFLALLWLAKEDKEDYIHDTLGPTSHITIYRKGNDRPSLCFFLRLAFPSLK